MKELDRLKEKIGKWYKELPDKKKYIEFLTAFLTIPVLVTVILINLGNLNQNKNKQTTTPVTTPIQIEIKTPTLSEPQKTTPVQPTSIEATPTVVTCKKQIGPISIISPKENEIITEDPVCIDISYEIGEYCAVAWSYKINNGAWSSYTDKEICLYNLTRGNKTLKLRVKSIASSDEKILERNFVYDGESFTATDSAQ